MILSLGKVVASNVGHIWLRGRRQWRLSIRVLVLLFGCLLWRRLDGVCHCLLGFQVEDDSQDQSGDQQILQINDAADCAGSMDLTCIKCDRRGSVTEHLHNLSPYSLHSMIEGSTKAWHAILYGTPEFIVFHDIMPGMMKFGLFYGRDHIGNSVRKISWRISWKI